MVHDAAVVEFTRSAVSLIVRRPHAYRFRLAHPDAPIPGFWVLDPATGHAVAVAAGEHCRRDLIAALAAPRRKTR